MKNTNLNDRESDQNTIKGISLTMLSLKSNKTPQMKDSTNIFHQSHILFQIQFFNK
jgi:hypothetical protein